MSLPAEKLELVRLLLDINDQETLDQIRLVLSRESNQETEYLLSEEANAEHLRQGMKQVNQGKYESVDIDKLWK
jgi:hypothetical protein